MYVKLINQVPTEWPVWEYQIRSAHMNVSLPEYIDDATALELGYAPFVVNGWPAEFNPMWETIEEITPVLKDGKYHQSYKITQKYSAEERKILEDKAFQNDNKQKASFFLKDTDWVELGDVANPDNPPYLTNKADFTAYRQQLRAIAINPPITVETWPAKPEEQWSV